MRLRRRRCGDSRDLKWRGPASGSNDPLADDAGGEDSVDVCSETDACAGPGAGAAIGAVCRVADSLSRATHEPVPHAHTARLYR